MPKPSCSPSLRSLLAFALALLGAFTLGVATARPWADEKLRVRVFVSVLPIQTFVERVGGEHVDVQSMVGPGFNPHTYDPTPQQIAALSGADLYVRTGVPFENAWWERIRSANRRMEILDARSGIDLLPSPGHAHDHGAHDEEGAHQKEGAHGGEDAATSGDPHVWTSPVLAKQMAAAIRDELTRIDPDHAVGYAQGYQDFARELEALDGEIAALVGDLPERKFMVFHPAWGYFAQRYDLVQVPIEFEGKEPGPRALAELIDKAKREGVKVVFVQPQFSTQSAEQIARAIGGRVAAADPLAADYADNLRRFAQAIASAFQP